ncbi:hypothetical protein V8E54_006996 [Elaphomyces granulatus]
MVPARNSPRVSISTASTAASSTSANAATNVTTDVSPEPAILQIQDNGNDLEEGGDNFIDSCYGSYYDGCYTVTMTATVTAATTQPRRFDGMAIQATCMCGKLDFDKYPRFATRRPGHFLPRRIRFQCESEAARRAQRTKRRQKATGGGDTTELATRKASMPTVQASKALESLKYKGLIFHLWLEGEDRRNCTHIGRCRDGIYNNSTHPFIIVRTRIGP